MRKIMTFVLLSMICFGFFMGAQRAIAEDSDYNKLRIKLSTSGTALGVDSLAAEKFGEMLKEASDGNIQVEVYPNCQLCGGSMPKNVALLSRGGLYEMAVLSAAVLGNLDEKYLVVQVPFTFANYDEVNEKIDTTGGEWLEKSLKEKNIKFLSGMHNGLKQITNSKRPIKTPADLEGLKIRIPGGEVGIKTFKTFGADPVAMSWSEVFTALQQGTVDGQENSYQTIDSGKIYEVQDYLTEWNYSYDGYYFLMNEEAWNKLNDATKELIQEKAQEAALWGRSYLEDGEKELKEKFVEEGLTITTLSKEELEPFVEEVRPVQEYFIEKFGEEACSAWGLE